MEHMPTDITVGDDMGDADPFDARSTFVASDGSPAAFVDIGALQRAGVCKLAEIPVSIRILLEAALRKCDGFLVTEEDVLRIASWSPEMIPEEIPFSPSRVILQDFTGVPAVVDIAALRDAMVAMGGDPEKVNPQVPVDLVVDHSVQVDVSGLFPDARQRNLEIEYERNLERYKFLKWGQHSLDNFRAVPPGRGIVHQVNLEWIASVAREEEQLWIPDTLVGTDSHTPHAGAIGSLAFGIGTTAIFNSWLTKDVRMSVPPSFKVEIRGTPAPNVTAKDYMLEILRHPYIRDGHAIGQIIEYAGPAVEELSIDERATMTNMAAEVGAFTGIIAADEKSVQFMVNERGMDRVHAQRLTQGMQSDPAAEYVTTIEIDASTIRPMAALPNDPGNGVYIDELGEEPIRIDIAYAGSCTAGKKEDMDMYARVLGEADSQGLKIHPDVKAYIQCGSTEVRKYCDEKGYMTLFGRMGAAFIEPGCGACIAAGPGVTNSPDEVSMSSQNRNFPGRSGPGNLYLGSPYSVAASAVVGYVTSWTPGQEFKQISARKLSTV